MSGTMHMTAGVGVSRVIWIIVRICGICPSQAPAQNNLKINIVHFSVFYNLTRVFIFEKKKKNNTLIEFPARRFSLRLTSNSARFIHYFGFDLQTEPNSVSSPPLAFACPNSRQFLYISAPHKCIRYITFEINYFFDEKIVQKKNK